MNTKKNKINTLNSDFKATVIAADLVHHGLPLTEVEILPLGGNRRAFAKEIEEIDHYTNETSGKKYTRININKEGLYDMLPEGLFHTLATGTEVLDEDIMIEDIQKKRQEEKDARKFFAPFEMELFHIKMLLEVYENRLDMQTSFDEMGSLLMHSWNELKFLNNKQRVIWMHFIPEIQFNKNNLQYCENLISLLINLPVSIRRKELQQNVSLYQTGNNHQFSLGNTKLGIDSVTMTSSKTTSNIIEIKLGPTAPHLIKDYLPHEKKEQIIKMTIDYLLPIDTEVKIVYDFLPENRYSQLSNNLIDSTTILGHTSYL